MVKLKIRTEFLNLCLAAFCSHLEPIVINLVYITACRIREAAIAQRRKSTRTDKAGHHNAEYVQMQGHSDRGC